MPYDPETGEFYDDAPPVVDNRQLQTPGQDPNSPPPGSDVQPDRLNYADQFALDQLQRAALLTQGALAPFQAASSRVASNRLAGVRTQSREQRMAAGFQQPGGNQRGQQNGDCGCKGTRGVCQVGRRKTQLYPATRIPDAFKLTHMAIKGYHCVFWRTTQIAVFTRKKSANLFCRAFNEALSHLGSAQTFDIPTLAAAFAAVIDGGSGQWGVKNGFNPPFHGANGTPADPVLA